MDRGYWHKVMREREISENEETWLRETGKRARTEECRREAALGELKPETLEAIKREVNQRRLEAELLENKGEQA